MELVLESVLSVVLDISATEVFETITESVLGLDMEILSRQG